jgi:hypothetical protein
MLSLRELQKVFAPTRTYVGQTVNPGFRFGELNITSFGRMNSNYWFQIKGIWYHKSVISVALRWSADIVITKDEHGAFKYIKYRGHGDLRPLNEAELKEMAWIILSAEKA